MSKRCRILCVLAACLCFLLGGLSVQASGATDEITDYVITVEVNEDATLNLHYHIQWKVLESDTAGPLTWVKIGIPNKHYVEYKALSDTIKTIKLDSSDGCYAEIYFRDSYTAGQTVSFDFLVVQDYLYQMNRPSQGQTKYTFTPGWFEEIDVKRLVVRWKEDKIVSFEPAGFIRDGYLEWETALGADERFTVDVVYPIDAFRFDETKTYDGGAKMSSFLSGVIIPGVVGIYLLATIIGLVKSCRGYSRSANLEPAFENKITRTKIVYHPVCVSCGGSRKEGEDVCAFCGRDMIKSKEIIEEKKVKKQDREALQYQKNGTYHYSSDPYTFVRVSTSRVRRPRPKSTSHYRSGGCVHSSCACACACAGGGRAGCSAKDFYNSSLRMSQLKRVLGKK